MNYENYPYDIFNPTGYHSVDSAEDALGDILS